MMKKITKKAQVAFNQFMFDTMMDKVRDAALLEEKIVVHEDLLKVHVQKIGDLGRDFTIFSDRVKKIEDYPKDGAAARRTWEIPDIRLVRIEQRIAALEADRDNLREHHMRDAARIAKLETSLSVWAVIADADQLNRETLIAQAAAIETLKTQATNSASRITALTNEVLKLRDAQKKHPFSEREEPVPCVDTKK